MIRRTIEVSGEAIGLSLSHQQLTISKDGSQVGHVPVEEVGILIVDTPAAHYSHPAVVSLLEQGAAIVFCGADHLPAGMALPAEGHHVQSERFRVQVEASVPCRKRIWQQIVREKIARQAELCEDPAARLRLERLAQSVRSGDPSNAESQAARVYWRTWMPEIQFRRKREGPFPNALLNYGYMALRAGVARSLVAAGFHPSLGLQHSNRYNAFCLADDLVEPLRPLVDWEVRTLVRSGATEIDRPAKQALLGLLTVTCETPAGEGPLLAALERYAASLHRCLAGEEAQIEIPRPVARRDAAPSGKSGGPHPCLPSMDTESCGPS